MDQLDTKDRKGKSGQDRRGQTEEEEVHGGRAAVPSRYLLRREGGRLFYLDEE